MDQRDMRLLSKEERAFLQAWQEMFVTSGWRLLMERAQREFDECAALYDKVGNDVGFARLQGFRNAANTLILTLENTIANEVDVLIEERKAIEAESLEDDVDAG